MLSLSPVAESATLLRRIGVVVGSVLVTLGYCLDVLWRAAARRLDRARVDRYTRGWAAAPAAQSSVAARVSRAIGEA
mgnify:CR=1 FL=1